jgi:histidinol-phosphate aminotransferase
MARLLKQGVIVRPIGGYGMPKHLRVTIGLAEREQRASSLPWRRLAPSIR